MYVHCSCLQTHQKRASDLMTDGCEPSCGCWDLNSEPPEEQSVFLITEPSLQPLVEDLSTVKLSVIILQLLFQVKVLYHDTRQDFTDFTIVC